MICWWCHWGWPKVIADIYAEALAEVGDGDVLAHGPAHIVWEDENWEDGDIDYCIRCCDGDPEFLKDRYKDCTAEELAAAMADFPAIKRSLLKLKAVPVSVRTEPDGYDEENPENFPPKPEQLPMVNQFSLASY